MPSFLPSLMGPMGVSRNQGGIARGKVTVPQGKVTGVPKAKGPLGAKGPRGGPSPGGPGALAPVRGPVRGSGGAPRPGQRLPRTFAPLRGRRVRGRVGPPGGAWAGVGGSWGPWVARRVRRGLGRLGVGAGGPEGGFPAPSPSPASRVPWPTPPGLPTPGTARTWRGRGAAWAATVRWGAAYVVHDLREVHWLVTAGWAPLGPRGSRRVRARRALRRYWAVRQAGNYVACLWLTVSLIVVGSAYVFAPYYAVHDTLVAAAQALAGAWASAMKAWGPARPPREAGESFWDDPFGPRGL